MKTEVNICIRLIMWHTPTSEDPYKYYIINRTLIEHLKKHAFF